MMVFETRASFWNSIHILSSAKSFSAFRISKMLDRWTWMKRRWWWCTNILNGLGCCTGAGLLSTMISKLAGGKRTLNGGCAGSDLFSCFFDRRHTAYDARYSSNKVVRLEGLEGPPRILRMVIQVLKMVRQSDRVKTSSCIAQIRSHTNISRGVMASNRQTWQTRVRYKKNAKLELDWKTVEPIAHWPNCFVPWVNDEKLIAVFHSLPFEPVAIHIINHESSHSMYIINKDTHTEMCPHRYMHLVV